MDEVEFKLASNNPILIAHGLSKILEAIKTKINNTSNNDIAKISELKSLYTKIKSDNSTVSSTACQALVYLVENKLLEISPTLSQFIALLSETKNYSAITAAMCNLLVLELKLKYSTENYSCPFSINAPQHPLITVLIQKNNAWRDVLGQMQSMLHCNSDSMINHVKLLRPVFMYILCNPSLNLPESCRQQTWHLLLKTQGTINLQMEILQWLRVNDPSSCMNTSNIVLELAEMAMTKNNHELCNALAPLIMALALDFLKHNLDPRPSINIIELILNFIDDSTEITGNIMVFLLSEILIITPTFCLIDMMKIGMLILTKLHCNEFVVHSLVASILPWLAYATSLSSDALDIGKNLVNTIITKSYRKNTSEELCSSRNPYSDIMCHANQHYQFYIEPGSFFNCINNDDLIYWLKKLSEIPKKNLFNYKLVLSGIFLCSNVSDVIKMSAKLLLKIAQSYKCFASYVLSVLLYKLTNIREIEVTKQLLIILPELAVSKENVPIIVHTLETFINAGAPLKYLAINLYIKAWLVEPRCHRHLLTALIDMNTKDKTMKGSVTCAMAMKLICEYRPEHGTELVPLLSNTLNYCTDMTGSAASAMALRSISTLCLSGVADVCSTWKVLSPKMNKEERPIVIKSMCEFFADIPSNPVHSEEEFDKLIDEVLIKLWQFACFETTRNMEIVESAFKALSTFPIDKMTLSVLPDQFKNDIQLSEKYAQSSSEETKKKLEDIFNYIPGTCWINMLKNIYEPARSIAGNFIIKLISDELYYFRTKIYMWPVGEPVNYKYLPEKSPSRAVGEYLRRYKINSTPHEQKVALECLRIFANKYPKHLPPIEWNRLNNVINISDETWSYGISIACHQVAMSPSAKNFLSKYLTKISAQSGEITEDEFKKYWHLCTHLEDICCGVMSNVLSPFLNLTVNYILDKAILGKQDFITMFEKLMIQYLNSLNNDLVHYDNKTLLTNILERLLNKINAKNKIFSSLVKAMLAMPTEQIERITLPSVWTEVTNEKLEKAIIIRAELVLKKDNEISSSWMNEIIRVTSSMPGMHKCLLENMARIQSHIHEKSNATWCWDLMCQIQTTIINPAETHSIDAIKFLCDTLFVSVIFLSCDNCMMTNDESIITSDNVRARLFPRAITHFASTSYWKNMIQQIMEWLNFMRTSLLPESYRIVFHNALISLKTEQCLNDLWTKYFSIQAPINL